MIIFQSYNYFPSLKSNNNEKKSSIQEQTYIPDDNFEAALISYGYDDVLDDYVITSNISSLKSLKLNDRQILDPTGIQDFIELTDLSFTNNLLTSLDISNNKALKNAWVNK